MEILKKSTDYSIGEINTRDEQLVQSAHDAVRVDVSALEYFCERFLRDEASDKIITSFLHPAADAVCPYCQTPISARALKSFNSLKRCVCKSCGKWFSATTGTLLQGCHNPRAVFLIAIFIALKTDVKQIAQLLNMHPTSIQQWQKKFRAVDGIIL